MKISSIKISIPAICMMAGVMSLHAEIPSGYYSACEGKTGQALLTALYQTITDHTTVSYSGLWDLYKTSDVDANGKIWDMYSTKRWTPGSDQCGTYKNVGDCYNREHSMPKSWFNDASPMYSDAFHLYPTDGKVNGQRSNYPFGECAGGTTLSGSGSVKALGRLGSSTFSGYSGTVFEPDDQYKGDFARSYFYMAACYNDRIASWNSDMLAKNSYPVFKDWAVNLLLKWARQDEVSDKERNRQEAVYARQKNRNPFIDHPELVEYIWGDKKGVAWHSTTAVEEADILQPVQDVVVDMGVGAINVARTYAVTVKTKNVKGPVSFSIYDQRGVLSVAVSQISAAQANAGYELNVTCNSPTAAEVLGTLSISADDMEREVDVKCRIVDGLPIYDPTGITSESFVIRWVNIGVADTYTLDVKLGNESLAGYPRSVSAAAESYTVSGLEPSTTYTYQLSAATLKSEQKSATTGAPVPSIDVLFDGTLHFDSEPGVPSSVAELLLDIENISEDIIVRVNEPFEISTDKSNWSRNLTLGQDEDRFYMRLNSATEGEFSTPIVLEAGTFMTDDAEATGSCVDAAAGGTVETFEILTDDNKDQYKPYQTNVTFTGTAFQWTLTDAGLQSGEGAAENNSKTVGCRFGKTATSALAMAGDKTGGIGTITYEAMKWNNTSEAEAVVDIDYSDDMGTTWTTIHTDTISETSFRTFTVPVKKTGTGRIRFRQTAGKRWILDNVAIPGYTEIQAVDDLEYHGWDAWCRDGRLVIGLRERGAHVAVYGMEGLTWVNESLGAGEHEFALPTGLYVVVSGDFVRRVVVK